MPRHHHPSSEPRTILGTIKAKLPTCHLCSWVWQAGEFVIKRPNAMCRDESHRGLLNATDPLTAWLQAS